MEPTKLIARLDDYKVETRSNVVTGAVKSIEIQNVGSTAHELKVIRTELPASDLPQSSGSVDTAKLDVVADSKEIKRREKASVAVHLSPGSYVLICNIPGHYALGMRESLTVVAVVP